jgi:GT2 family glycosyltransferase
VPRLTAIVPATDSPPTVERCRDAIASAVQPPDELLIVESVAAPGPAAARNAGALVARGDVLVFVDSDVIVHPDAFGRIRAAFDAQPDLIALFGSYDDAPPERGAVSSFRNLLHHHVHQHCDGPTCTFWAGLGAIRRDAFLEAGGFDAARFRHPSVEDIDLGMRLARRGARLELDPLLLGTHLKAWTLVRMLRTDLTLRGAPWVAVLLRHGTAGSTLNLAWRHRLSSAASLFALRALAGRRPVSAFVALALLALNNRSLYGLLLRRGGPWQALAGVGLHAVHNLTAAASVPLGALSYLRDRDHRAPPSLAGAVTAADTGESGPVPLPESERVTASA